MASRDWVGQMVFVSCTRACAKGMLMIRALGLNRALRDVLENG